MQGAALVNSTPKLQCDKQMTQAGKQAGDKQQPTEREKKKEEMGYAWAPL